MAFNFESEPFQELGGALGVGVAIAGRVVGGHLDELCEKGRLGRLMLTKDACNGFPRSVAHWLYSLWCRQVIDSLPWV